MASSISAAERPSSHGSDHRRSRTPEPKRRHGESPRHQSSRRDCHSSDRRESERARPSSSGGSSSRRRAESGSVSKASDTRPSSSSSRHHQHLSTGDRPSLSSSSSRASPDRKSQPSHRERRRESSDRTGGTFVVRREFQLSPPKSKTPEKRTITVVASAARQIHIESAPAVPVPALVADGSAGAGPVADGSAGAGPAASGGSTTSDGPAVCNGTVTGNDPATDLRSATGNGPATGDSPATGDGSATGDGWATGDGPATVVRRAKEADRQARTPVRPPRTPVRRSRNHIESGDSRSRSPLSRSSSVESAARDESPLNFNAALDLDSKRAFSEDEDAEGDGKKISAAQYDTFRQAVTSSKGTFKINPAKTKRAARASLLDLGETEVPDRVSWLDQPSLQDTMASKAQIAQGLKEDEEVVKTTLSETLNDNTSSFKFLTVKHIFPREPYRLKVHRDALYAPKPPDDHGFINSKTPSSYHLSHSVCLDTEELARRSAIYASLADSMVASVIEELSPKDERSKFLREKLTIIQEAQVSAVSAGFAAASNLQLLRRDALLRNFNFQPPVLSAVRTAPFEGHHVVGPEPKVLQARVRAIRQADHMTGSSVTFARQKEVKTSTKTSSKKTAPRPSVFDRLGSPTSTTQRTVTQEPPFPAVFFCFRSQETLTGPRWGLA